MNKNLQRKLSAYAATTAGAVALGGTADAQIVHVDINPDVVVHDTVYYDLDLNGDGINELHFNVEGYGTSYGPVRLVEVSVTGNNNNAVLGSLLYGYYPAPFAKNSGDSISSTGTIWNNGSVNGGLQYLGVVTPYGNYGNWIGATDKYLGVRFQIGSNTHYGWVRLSVTAGGDSIIIKEYAYQMLPGVGLTAGQLVGINDAGEVDPIVIFATGTTVVMQNTGYDKGGKVRVYNTSGQTVYESALTEDYMNISLAGESTGIYFVEVARGNGTRVVRKVYVQ